MLQGGDHTGRLNSVAWFNTFPLLMDDNTEEYLAARGTPVMLQHLNFTLINFIFGLVF